MPDYNSGFEHIVSQQTLQASLSDKFVRVRLAVWQVRLPGKREYNPSPPASTQCPLPTPPIVSANHSQTASTAIYFLCHDLSEHFQFSKLILDSAESDYPILVLIIVQSH